MESWKGGKGVERRKGSYRKIHTCVLLLLFIIFIIINVAKKRMGLLDSILGKDKKKGPPPLNNTTKKDNDNAGVKLPTLTNPFTWAAQPQAFGGAGQSLGGTQPGIVVPISLFNPGPLGVKVCTVPQYSDDGNVHLSSRVYGVSLTHGFPSLFLSLDRSKGDPTRKGRPLFMTSFQDLRQRPRG